MDFSLQLNIKIPMCLPLKLALKVTISALLFHVFITQKVNEFQKRLSAVKSNANRCNRKIERF